MAVENLQNVTFLSGRLVSNPTTLVGSFPFGGTALGLARDIVVMPTTLSYQVKAEEFGNVTVDVVDGGRSWVLGANLRGYDTDALVTVFPGTNTGSSSGLFGIRETSTGAGRGGRLHSADSIVLLHVPDDTDRHRATLLYRAVPLVDEAAELNLQLANEFMIAVMFIAIPDTSGNVFAHELLEDMSLT